MTTHCAWCGKRLTEEEGFSGSGPDLLCSDTCSGKYWSDLDEAWDLVPKSIEERLEDAEDFFAELPDFDN